jgi:hypothetical protein
MAGAGSSVDPAPPWVVWDDRGRLDHVPERECLPGEPDHDPLIRAQGLHQRSRSRLRRKANGLRPLIESLGDRLMFDAGGSSHPRPSAIVVGHTRSSYFVDGIPINQETIRDSVAHEQADPQARVVLRRILAPGRREPMV